MTHWKVIFLISLLLLSVGSKAQFSSKDTLSLSSEAHMVQPTSRVQASLNVTKQTTRKPLFKRKGFWISTAALAGTIGAAVLLNSQGNVVLGRNVAALGAINSALYIGISSISNKDKKDRKNKPATPSKVIRPANLIAENLKFSEESGNNILDALEGGEVSFTIRNAGTGEAKNVQINPNLKKGYDIDIEDRIYLGDIKPGQAKNVTIKLKGGRNIKTIDEELTITISELNDFVPSPQKVKFQTRKYDEPELAVIDIGIENDAGSGLIRPNTEISLSVLVANKGQNIAEDVRITFSRGENVFFLNDNAFEKEIQIGSLKGGSTKLIELDFFFNTKAETQIPISYKFNHKYSLRNKEFTSLGLVQNESIRASSDLVVKARESERNENLTFDSDLSIDIEQDIPKTPKKRKNAIGIILGIEDYKNVKSSVTFAKRDVAYVEQYFSSTVGISAERIKTHSNDEVTKAAIEKLFSPNGWLDSRADTNTEVFIYYVGHGAPSLKEESAYLIPYDGDPNYPEITGYSLDKLLLNLSSFEFKSINIFIDACFSGEGRSEEMLLANARGVGIIKEVNRSHVGLNVFTAAKGNQIATAWPAKKHGLFTYYTLKGMRGDADLNSDDAITSEELCKYIEKEVERESAFLDRTQTPECRLSNKNKVVVYLR